ncbi:MAG: hypothetical protein R2713_13100 [Ilumatobacteraceae bacterium]
MVSEGPKRFFLPTGVAVLDGRLVVADAWHHRLLVWDGVPTTNDEEPAMVLGQLDGIDGWTRGAARSGSTGRSGSHWWTGCSGWPTRATDGCSGWTAFPPPAGADVVLGQPDLVSRGENRDGPVAADSVRWRTPSPRWAARCSWPTPATIGSSGGISRSASIGRPTS